MDLDRTVQHYLPELLPASYPPITARQVLTYQSGINGVAVPHKEPAWFFAHRYDTWAPGSRLDLTRPAGVRAGHERGYEAMPDGTWVDVTRANPPAGLCRRRSST